MSNTKTKFQGENRVVWVKPVDRPVGVVKDPEHENYFLFGTSTFNLSLPANKNTAHGDRLVLVNPFRKREEKEWLEEELSLSLNHLQKASDTQENFWENHQIKLNKSPKKLNLSQPFDYIDYLVLLANKDVVAPTWEDRYKKASYRYVIQDEDAEVKSKANKVSNKAEAYMEYGKIATDKDKLISVLKLAGLKVAPESKLSFLQTKVAELLERNPAEFLLWVKDTHFDLKIFIEDCVQYGILKREKQQFFLQPNGDPLCDDGEVSRIDVVVKYLLNPMNNDIYESLKARLELAKK